MAGELEKVANDLMAALDSKDVDRIVESIGQDAQGVDEISRRWLRGEGELDSYLRQMLGAVSDVRSELQDAQERVWGDVGVSIIDLAGMIGFVAITVREDEQRSVPVFRPADPVRRARDFT